VLATAPEAAAFWAIVIPVKPTACTRATAELIPSAKSGMQPCTFAANVRRLTSLLQLVAMRMTCAFARPPPLT
jgi:hypothetical protein